MRRRRTAAVIAGLLSLPGVVVVAGPAHASGASSIGDIQNQLSGCEGTVSDPTQITLTNDVTASTTALTVTCVAQLILAGNNLTIASLSVNTGEVLIVGDPTNAAVDNGVLSARGAGSASGISLTLSRLEVDDGTVTTTDITAENHGRLDVAGGNVVVSNTAQTGDSGVDLGDSGVLSVSDNGTLVGRGGAGRADGIAVGDDGSVLVAGGRMIGTGASGGAGVTVGDGGSVVVVSGDLTASGGSKQAGVNIPSGARLSMAGGTLEATGGASGAGIGGAQGGTTGLIQIDGGAVTAVGGDSASGVGDGAGGTSGPLVMTDGSLTASAPANGTAIGIDGVSGPVKIEGGTLRLPAGPMLIPDSLSGDAELGIGPHAVLDGSDPALGSQTYATYTGSGQLKNGGTVKVPVSTIEAGGVTLIGNYRTVSFDTQGGSPSSIPSATVVAPSFALGGVPFPGPPTMQYHTFLGWNSQPDGSGTPISATSKLPGGSTDGQPFPVTAYAIFQYLPPALRATLTSKQPLTAGWYRAPVKIHYACKAGTLPLTTPCPTTVVLKHQLRKLTVSRSIKDTRGRVTTATVVVSIDLTTPDVQVRGVKPGATYSGLRKVGCRVTDALSGPGGCRVTTKRKGHTVTYKLVGLDVAGNFKVVVGHYTIS